MSFQQNAEPGAARRSPCDARGGGAHPCPHLFHPRQIGKLLSRNSVKYAACSVSNFNTRDGFVSEREMGRMAVICRTGAGIITNQGAYPDPEGMGKAYYRMLSIADDRYIPGLARIAEMIHEGGAIAIQQILHGGRYGGIDSDHCEQASDVPQTLRHFRPPHRMTKDGIRACIGHHVAAAKRALLAGYDGVELTAFMGYLLANFLSSFTNDRKDEYGGSVENRGRFLRELLSRTREAIGDAVLWVRLNGEELLDERGGSTPEECLEFMRMAEAAGADGVSIVVGWHESSKGALGRDLPTSHWLYLAERAKAAIRIPLAFGPRFGDPSLANEAIEAGKFDFWEVCRPFLADPELLHKVAGDRMAEIRPCMGGLNCLSRMFRNLPYICAVNPRLGHEYDPVYEVQPAAVPKTVLVAGGGPAGMECALQAARRGHHVRLFEKADGLGGQMRMAAFEVQAGGEAFRRLTASYEAQLQAAGVEIVLGREVDRALVRDVGPDVCVVATGAVIANGMFPGADAATVVNPSFTEASQVPAGLRVCVIGAERAGLVLAEYLASVGRQVSVIGDGPLGPDVVPTFKWRHLAWLKEYGVTSYPHARVERLSRKGVHIILADSETRFIEADLIVVAAPRTSLNVLSRELDLAVDELYTIGDAVLPRNVQAAVHEGFRIGSRI